MEDNNLVRKVAELGNMNVMILLVRLQKKIYILVMILFILVAFIALSVGLAFFFLVPGTIGYAIGITMFVVAGLLFTVGEINYFAKMKKIQIE